MLKVYLSLYTLLRSHLFVNCCIRRYLFSLQNTYVHKGEKVFFLNTLKSSLAPTPQEGSFRVMFVVTHHTQEQKEPKTCEREGQNATKLRPAPQKSPWPVMSILMRILCLCLALMNLLFSIAPLFHLCDLGSIETASSRDRRLFL